MIWRNPIARVVLWALGCFVYGMALGPFVRPKWLAASAALVIGAAWAWIVLPPMPGFERRKWRRK